MVNVDKIKRRDAERAVAAGQCDGFVVHTEFSPAFDSAERIPARKDCIEPKPGN
jgi:hypothetical protein